MPSRDEAGERIVLKYPVQMPNGTGRSFIDIPPGSEILSVGLQLDEMVVWVLAHAGDEERKQDELVLHRLIVLNTGREIPGFPDGARFLDRLTTSNGTVWHVWDGDHA